MLLHVLFYVHCFNDRVAALSGMLGRATANAATVLHTVATLDIKGLIVPPGDYAVFARVDVTPWQLIINRPTRTRTGHWVAAPDSRGPVNPAIVEGDARSRRPVANGTPERSARRGRQCAAPCEGAGRLDP
jgi:hypothetical protein